MKILSGGDIAKEVKGINPQYIAVGYIGKDWHRYIDIEFVKEIISLKSGIKTYNCFRRKI